MRSERQPDRQGESAEILPVVAIVGRPNVGKSTLFNRLCGERKALVDDTPGVTRDRLVATVTWEDAIFRLVDTGGLEPEAGDDMQSQVQRQAQAAVEEADVVLFLADGKEGLHPDDHQVVELLRRAGKPVFFGVNKIDGPEQELLLYEFYALGVDRLYPVSAAHGYGVRQFVDAVVRALPPAAAAAPSGPGIRVAILGRPNVGKSTLINRLVGEERLVVSEVPGTTRDAVDVTLKGATGEFLLVDTPGIRRRSKTHDKIEKFSVLKSLRSIDRCHVAVLVLDAGAGVSAQDVRIAGYIHERHRGAIVAVNKWDLLQGKTKERELFRQDLEQKLRFMPYAPRLFISALRGGGVQRLLPLVSEVFSQYGSRVATASLNEKVEAIVARHEPPVHGPHRLKIYYVTQPQSRPPTFVFFVNRPQAVHFSYERYLANQLRREFNLDKTPVRLIFRGRGEGGDKR